MPSTALKTTPAPHAIAEAFERHAAAHAAATETSAALAGDPGLASAVEDSWDRIDAAALPRATARALTAVEAMRARLSALGTDPGEWTVDAAWAAAEAVSAALAHIPDRADLEAAAHADREAAEQRAVLTALEAEMDALAGRGDATRDPRVRKASGAMRTLRAKHGMTSLPQADHALSRLIQERTSLARLRQAWAEVATHAGFAIPSAFHPAKARAVAEQVSAIGIEGVLRALSLPANAIEVVEAFEHDRSDVEEGWAATSAAFGTAWTNAAWKRLALAATLVDTDDPKAPKAREYAEQVGLGGVEGQTLTAVSELMRRAEALDGDVEAAKVIGPEFAGRASRLDALRDQLERWSWMMSAADGEHETAAVRDLLRNGTVLAKARFVDVVDQVLALTTAHEDDFGAGWEDRPSEQPRIEELTSLVAEVDALRPFAGEAERSGAFAAVFKALAVSDRLGAERSALEAIGHGHVIDGAGAAVAAAMAEAVAAIVELGPHDARAATGDAWTLNVAACELRAATEAAGSTLRPVFEAAGFDYLEGSCTLSEAVNRLSLGETCARRAVAIAELSAARAALEGLGLGTTMANLERAGTHPKDWGRKSHGLVALPGDRAEHDVRHVRTAMENGRESPILFAVPASTPAVDHGGAWDEEEFPSYTRRDTETGLVDRAGMYATTQ